MSEPFSAFIAHVIRQGGKSVPAARAFAVPADDLFSTVETFISSLLDGRFPAPLEHGTSSGLVAFVVGAVAVITIDIRAARPSHVQCLIVRLRDMPEGPSGPLVGYPLDPKTGLVLWTRSGPSVAEALGAKWNEIISLGQVDQLVALTTPWLYGNKLRLTRFLGPVAATVFRPGMPVLDLMAGTGIVGRVLSERHPVTVNDPNPYASLLSRSHGIIARDIDQPSITNVLKAPYSHNYTCLEKLVLAPLQEESLFLHGDFDQPALDAYIKFASSEILSVTDGAAAQPARLITERYANVYFGVTQAVELDSLRFAIEHSYPQDCAERSLCLCALLLASIACATGPHFAQPTKVRSIKAFRTIVERRARSILWEFELALSRLIARPETIHPVSHLAGQDWREAIADFIGRNPRARTGIYVDPPYSKLQYSRYYHVLNVLLAYDYPTVSGIGRYPPKDLRFSSRFEYQPGIAQRELIALIKTCAEYKITMILSYGNAGFADIGDLGVAMGEHFERVDLFSEELRHHSQGRQLDSARATIIEHALVGHPGR